MINKIPTEKVILNKLADLNFFIMTGVYVSDVASGFRAYTKGAVKIILPELEKLNDDQLRYGIDAHILRIAVKNNLSIKHVSVNFDYTQGKKANLWKLFKGYMMFDLYCLKELFR